jgi:lipopolysaccharide export LptBFGC system permease protein LptF
MLSKGERYNLRRAALFGLLSGCFGSLVYVAASAGLVLSGVGSFGPISQTIHWLLAIFGLSAVLTTLVILLFESYSEP